MFVIVREPINVREVEKAVQWPGAGAVLSFVGVARDNFEGRAVLGLEYEAYDEMCLPVMEQIRDEVVGKVPGVRVAMAHRVGRLEIGEASVVISVAAPHRAAAYEANRLAIDLLKAKLPVWKKEVYADGASWKANEESVDRGSS